MATPRLPLLASWDRVKQHGFPLPADQLKLLQETGFIDKLRRLGEELPLDDANQLRMPDHMPRPDDALLSSLSFFRTCIEDAEFADLTLPWTFFNRSEVTGVTFKNTDLRGSFMCWNDWSRCDFTDADLTGCDMRASGFEQCRFVRSTLVDADLRRSDFDGCDLTGANLAGAKLTCAQGQRLDLSDSQRRVIDWQDADGPEPDGG
jgi:uncharacterized protein YjbI with pentapeptide repeats